MIRVWLAHNALHVSMLLGMWEDAADCEIDERKAWGHLLADLTRHIANGLQQSHGWAEKSTIAWIRQEFLENLADDSHTVYADE
jgi:predicted secreted Zn-dependent protease